MSGLWKTMRRFGGAAETSKAKGRRREIGHNRDPYYGVATREMLGKKGSAKEFIRIARDQGAVKEGKGKRQRWMLPESSASRQLLGD